MAGQYNYADPRLNQFQGLADEIAAANAGGVLNKGYYDDLVARRNALLGAMSADQQAQVRSTWYGGAPESAATDFMGYLAGQDAATRGGLADGAMPAGPTQTWASWQPNPTQTGGPGNVDKVAVQQAAGPGYYNWIDRSQRIKDFAALGDAVRYGNSGKTYDQILAERDALLGGMTDQEREYIDQSFYGNRGNKTGKLDDFMTYIRSMDGWGRTDYDALVARNKPQGGGGGGGQQADQTSTVAGGSNPVRTSVTSSTGTTPAGDAPRSRSADIISGSISPRATRIVN